MSMTCRITEDDNLVATIQTVTGTGSWYTDVIALASTSGRRFEAMVNVGTIGAGASVNFGFQWSATSGGTYAALAGAAITADTAGSLTHRIEVSTEQVVQLHPTAGFMKGYLQIATASTPTGVIVHSRDQAYRPITNLAAAIGQVVTTDA